MKGLVIKNTGSWYTVLTDDGQTVDCKIKGNFRLKGIRSTNPVAVGDRVTISPAGVQSASRVQSSFSTKAAKPSANAASQRSKGQSPSDAQDIVEDPQPPILGGSGWLIDTPGIKGFGTFDMEP